MPVSLLERRLEIDSSVRQGQSQVAFPVHLPTELPVDSFGVNAVLDRMQFDKKAIGGKLRFVLPASLGHVELVDPVPESEVRLLLAEIIESA